MSTPLVRPDGRPLSPSERKRRWKEKHKDDRGIRTFHLPTGASAILEQDASALDVSDSTYLTAAILLAQRHHGEMSAHIHEARMRYLLQVHPRSKDRGPRGVRAPLEKLSGGE
ncbi:hypothetical protein [Dyella sp. 2HG41-7]|uniref:hypothetical protein n=1 Tax=Dyella sp. 2HG41-7 TaxID=2883239 RepID=UPI001F33488F|nr:hypothetical protein [Dyella sp. 2HG41-7]